MTTTKPRWVENLFSPQEIARALHRRIRKRSLVPVYYAFCRGGSTPHQGVTKFGFSGSGLPQESLRLDGSGITLPFQCPAPYLDEVALLFGTYDRVNTCSVRFQLYRGRTVSGTPLVEKSVCADQMRDNQFYSFRFPKIEAAQNAWFCIRISSPDSHAQNTLGIWTKKISGKIPDSPIDSCVTYQNGFDELTPLERDFFIPHFRITSANRECSSGWHHISDALFPFPLLGDTRISTPFMSDDSGISEISFLFGTFDRVNSCTISLTLEDASSGEVVFSRSVNAGEVENNRHFSFLVPAEVTSAAKQLRLVLTSPDASPDNSVAVWGNRLSSIAPELDAIVSHAQKFGFPSAVNFRNNLKPPRPTLRQSVPQRISTPLAERHVAFLASCERLAWPSPFLARFVEELCAMGMQVTYFDVDDVLALRDSLSSFHTLIVPRTPLSDSIRDLISEVRALRIPVIGLVENAEPVNGTTARLAGLSAESTARRITREITLTSTLQNGCDFLLTEEEIAHSWHSLRDRLELMRSEYLKRYLPKVSIVSILYGKEREIRDFLRSVQRQNYPGEIEIILVNDKTRDNSVPVANQTMQQLEPRSVNGTRPELKVIENERNLGNCGSRNRGIEHSSGDILIIIDADCLLNSAFIEEHVQAHARRDCDVAIGPFNLESEMLNPMDALVQFEGDSDLVERSMELQDPLNRESFLNCITRNISIHREFLTRTSLLNNPFDELFAYSEDPRSGYGWEDVEFGFRLYEQGARICFINNAFSVHCSHPAVTEESSKPNRSLLNFWRLLEKHPSLALVARRWCNEVFSKLCAWADTLHIDPSPERRKLEALLAPGAPLLLKYSVKRRLKILTHRWHCPHQYELYKLPHDFTLLKHVGPPFTNDWEYAQRPLPSNATFQTVHDINPKDFDVAIIHFDENALAPERTNGVLESSWGNALRWFMENVPIPKVAVCHGTPQFYGQYDGTYQLPNLGEVIEEERARLVDFLRDVFVISNSHQAHREWSFHNSQVIWQGFDPTEFPAARYERGILSYGTSMKERPHYRGYALFNQVMDGFPSELLPSTISVKEPDLTYLPKTNRYAQRRFRNYVDGMRPYSVFFNPTIRSPMPRWRGEAMMCGLVTVSAHNHDVDMFIKNGENGFYSNDPNELREMLLFLSKNPEKARAIGERGRATALDVFNHDRYLRAWDAVLTSVLKT